MNEPLEYSDEWRRKTALEAIDILMEDIAPRCAPHPDDHLQSVGLPRFLRLSDLGVPPTTEGDRITIVWTCPRTPGETHRVAYPASPFLEPAEWVPVWMGCRGADHAAFLCDLHARRGWAAMVEAIDTLN